MPMLAVAPHWGAWIEIQTDVEKVQADIVAPHWGAWIEIAANCSHQSMISCRTPLGCVD